MSDELKPCPLCGRHVKMGVHHEGGAIFCGGNCSMFVLVLGNNSSVGALAKRWNTRAYEKELYELREKLKASEEMVKRMRCCTVCRELIVHNGNVECSLTGEKAYFNECCESFNPRGIP